MKADWDRIAEALPGFVVCGDLGHGSFGDVFEAEQVSLRRRVAIKRLFAHHGSDAVVRSRFSREAQILAALDHPHIVPAIDYREYQELCLIVMELLPEGTVWDRLKRGNLSAETACAIGIATCSALEHAHRNHVLHRDIKPQNLMFGPSGRLKVTDFGISKVVGGPSSRLTGTNELVGTPEYMAPEQASRGELTVAIDIYALGIVVFELLSGRLPFDDEGVAALLQHVNEQPIELRDAKPEISGMLARVIMRAIATAPSDRYSSAEEFGIAIANAARGCWGPKWLLRSELDVMCTGQLGQAISEQHPKGTDDNQLDELVHQVAKGLAPLSPTGANRTRDLADKDGMELHEASLAILDKVEHLLTSRNADIADLEHALNAALIEGVVKRNELVHLVQLQQLAGRPKHINSFGNVQAKTAIIGSQITARDFTIT